MCPPPHRLAARSHFTNAWSDANNVLHEHFELYSSWASLRAGGAEERWQHCDFNRAGVGFPSGCMRFPPGAKHAAAQAAAKVAEGSYMAHKSRHAELGMGAKDAALFVRAPSAVARGGGGVAGAAWAWLTWLLWLALKLVLWGVASALLLVLAAHAWERRRGRLPVYSSGGRQ